MRWFLVLAAYYELKTAREVFILSEGGAEVKSYSSAGQALLLLVLVPAYGAFASKVNRERLVTWVTLFFVVNVLLFAAAYQTGLHIGIAYFLWVGSFNVMVIAQFWALANDLFTPEQGKRIFPLIGVGSSLGAWVGIKRMGDYSMKRISREKTGVGDGRNTCLSLVSDSLNSRGLPKTNTCRWCPGRKEVRKKMRPNRLPFYSGKVRLVSD